MRLTVAVEGPLVGAGTKAAVSGYELSGFALISTVVDHAPETQGTEALLAPLSCTEVPPWQTPDTGKLLRLPMGTT
jgi:hypothetical protein